MSVVKLDNNFRGLEWRKAFAGRLIQLRPQMNPDAADEVSDSEFVNSSSFSPLDAADRYVDTGGMPPEGDEASEKGVQDPSRTPVRK